MCVCVWVCVCVRVGGGVGEGALRGGHRAVIYFSCFTVLYTSGRSFGGTWSSCVHSHPMFKRTLHRLNRRSSLVWLPYAYAQVLAIRRSVGSSAATCSLTGPR